MFADRDAIGIGDVVRLKAGGSPMRVIEVRSGCDGTGGDGSGLRCEWVSEFKAGKTFIESAWLSESSVERVQ